MTRAFVIFLSAFLTALSVDWFFTGHHNHALCGAAAIFFGLVTVALIARG